MPFLHFPFTFVHFPSYFRFNLKADQGTPDPGSKSKVSYAISPRGHVSLTRVRICPLTYSLGTSDSLLMANNNAQIA